MPAGHDAEATHDEPVKKDSELPDVVHAEHVVAEVLQAVHLGSHS